MNVAHIGSIFYSFIYVFIKSWIYRLQKCDVLQIDILGRAQSFANWSLVSQMTGKLKQTTCGHVQYFYNQTDLLVTSRICFISPSGFNLY